MEAIKIYTVDSNLSIDLCFQDVLRKLVSGSRIVNIFAENCAKFFLFMETASCRKAIKLLQSILTHVLHISLSLFLSSLLPSLSLESREIGTQYSSQFQFCQVCSIKFPVLQNKIPPQLL